ncbi:MAG: Rieske (2Fe-2S) protein [Anaerolineales bacterium]|nr:Rieske (2Fe-2S) protein [Anaerolineales bacterium]
MEESDSRLERRGFLTLAKRILIASGLAAFFGPVISFFWPNVLEETPTKPVVIGPEGAIPPLESKVVRFGRYPAIVINTQEKGLVAYSAVCTHFACIVSWNPESGMIECPCHAGFYDPLDGSVISGPPPSPLPVYRVSTDNGQIILRSS